LNRARTGETFAGPVDIGFPINFFGQTYDELFVNMDGNVSFVAPVPDFSPAGLSGPTGTPMIAPFLADIDTFDSASGLVHYGRTSYQGRDAFCVDWFTREADGTTTGVGYFDGHADKLNVFQLLIVEAPAGGQTGDFDIVFNYDLVTWESGDGAGGLNGLGGSCAHAGYSDGTGTRTRSFELIGSGVCGAFTDSNPSTGLVNTTNRRLSEPNGRWVFGVRSGEPPTGGSIRGTVKDRDGIGIASTAIQVCRVRDIGGRPTSGPCVATGTNAGGDYMVAPLPDGSYNTRAIASGFSHLPGSRGPDVVRLGSNLVDKDIVLRLPKRMPADVTLVTGGREIAGGLPVLYWGAATRIKKKNCRHGRGTWSISYPDGGRTSAGVMVEAPPGSGNYEGVLPRQHPNHGTFTMTLTIHCRNPEKIVVETFAGYIDPSGVVVDTNGALIPGATVTLYRSEDEYGPFAQVPDQDAIMSPSNRTNPDTTDAVGHFGWDVIAGWYVVRAEAAGCTSPDDPSQSFVDTDALPIPPPVFDLVLVLKCPVSNFASKVRLKKIGGVFKGRVSSRGAICIEGRGVILRKRRAGDDRRVARTITNAAGEFRFPRLPRSPGRYYAGAPKRLLGAPGSQVSCLRGVSTIRRA
jgi:hypothetical protein